MDSKELKEFTDLLEEVENNLSTKLNKLNEHYKLNEQLQDGIKLQQSQTDKTNVDRQKAREDLEKAKQAAALASNPTDAAVASKKLELAKTKSGMADVKYKENKAKLSQMQNSIQHESHLHLTTNKANLNEASEKLSQEELYNYSISRETGEIINYLLNGIRPESGETFAIGVKLEKSAISKNIAYKLYKELDKIHPNKEEIKKLRHELAVQIAKCKRGD